MSYSHSLWLKEQQPERNLLSSVTYKGCIDRGGQIAAESGTALDGTPVFLIHRMCEGKAELHDANGSLVGTVEFMNNGVIVDVGEIRIGIK